MDIGKLIKDIFTGNTRDLRKRTDLLERKWRRLLFQMQGRHSQVLIENIPVIINNRNRFSFLMMLITWLEKIGMKNIIILDNDSSYPPLLEYYRTTKHKVIFLKRNGGPRSLWETEELKDYMKGYYIYTDPDVVPASSSSMESITMMFSELKSNFSIDKIGFALRIDDLPDNFKLKQDVIQWEQQFWKNPINDKFFSAPVDTTFALYAPYAMGGGECKAYRTNFPQVAAHMPWYENSSAPTEEDEYYRKHAKPQDSHWTELTRKG
jgi:hypothetical protein